MVSICAKANVSAHASRRNERSVFLPVYISYCVLDLLMLIKDQWEEGY